jgi:hypothetical protein
MKGTQKTMSKLNLSRIDDAETMLRKELSAFKQKNRTGKDLKRLKLLEGAVQHLEALRLVGIVFLLTLAGCVADEAVPYGDDVQEPDAGKAAPDAGELADAMPEPQACNPLGHYTTTFAPGPGTCGLTDIGVLAFEVAEAGSGGWQILSGTPLVDGTVFDVDGKCAIDVWRTAPYGQAVMQIHASMREDDDGDGIAYGVAMVGVYSYESGITCQQAFTPTATVTVL